MSLSELLPWLTGSGGAIAVMAAGGYLLLTGRLVTGREFKRVIAGQEKLEQANNVLIESLRVQREQNSQLLNSSEVTTGLLRALQDLAHERRATAGTQEAS